MGDSDDEYGDRKRRDKFRGERTESYRSGEGRREDRRRDEWMDRWVHFLYLINLLYPLYSMDRESSFVGPNHQKTMKCQLNIWMYLEVPRTQKSGLERMCVCMFLLSMC